MMKILLMIVVATTVLTLCLLFTSRHWWRKCRGVIVTYNGQVVSDVKIYSSRDGNVLVHLEKSEWMYIVRPENQEMGMPNRSDFFILPGYAFSRDVSPLLVPMGKAATDPQLIIKQDSIEFNVKNNERIHVNWPSDR